MIATNKFCLSNESSRDVIFCIRPDNSDGMQKFSVAAGCVEYFPTDPARASYGVYVVDEVNTSATMLSKQLNTTFKVTDESFSAYEPFVMQSSKDQESQSFDISNRVREIKNNKNLNNLVALADESLEKWSRGEVGEVHVLDAICRVLASFDLGDGDKQESVVQRCAVTVLSKSEVLPVLMQVAFALRLTEPASAPDSLPLSTRTGFWLRARTRLMDVIDPAFDPSAIPQLLVAPPPETGLPPGVSPDAVEDARHRAAYVLAIEKNRAAAALYLAQFQYRQAQIKLDLGLKKYSFATYARPRFDDAELARLLLTHQVGREDAARTADILTPIRDAIAKSRSTALDVTEVHAIALDNFDGRNLNEFCIGEVVYVSLGQDGGDMLAGEQRDSIVWHVECGDASVVYGDRDGHAMVHFGASPGRVVLVATVSPHSDTLHVRARIELLVVAPTGASMSQRPGTGIEHKVNTWSVGFKGLIHLSPGGVSYAGILFREGTAKATATGWLSAWNNLEHKNGSPATITGTQVNGVDTVFSGEKTSPYGAGDFNWPIPWQYSADNGVTWSQITVANHYATSSASGAAMIQKAGAGPFTKQATDATSHY